MLSRRKWLMGLAVFGVTTPIAGLVWREVHGAGMKEINFDLGKDIVETAKKSGVPAFSARRVASTVSYSVNGIPAEIPVRYARAGHEVSWQPVFAFTMYANADSMKVDTVTLQWHSQDLTDEQAQAFAEATIAQFQRGKWQRYGDPKENVLLTGRSSYLDENGEFQDICMTMDPNFKVPIEDWRILSRKGMRWQWVGEGILAKFDVDNSPGKDGKPAYRMALDFYVLEARRKLWAENLARELKEGDAKGWNSTAEHEANQKELAEILRKREAAALKRGDSVVPMPVY